MYFRKRVKVDPELMQQLIARQDELTSQLILKPLGFTPKIIAGVDSSLIGEDKIFSVIVAMKYPELEVIEVATSESDIPIPYIPGFLAFREIPNLLEAFKKLKTRPELIVVDGNGIIHKRRMGIASHLGIMLEIPTFGIAKNLLVGKFAMPSLEAVNYTPVFHKDEQLGFAVRTKTNVKPVFVSPGHLINLEDSLNLSISMIGKYRLPEPTRIADKLSKELKPKFPAGDILSL